MNRLAATTSSTKTPASSQYIFQWVKSIAKTIHATNGIMLTVEAITIPQAVLILALTARPFVFRPSILDRF